ncbi:MAG: MerR family transcriptional regulator [Acidimicrobiales bacterium]|jgi:DNA-binding transcriptional MerR regulator
MTNQGTMRIGEVHAILRRDVPDIELSKIRYYEDKGLVQPTRSRKGYRLYSQRDVDCLREAIRLAHEEFVPLRVVRLRLIEQGLLDDTPVASGTTRQVARTTSNVISVPVPVSEPTEEPVDTLATSVVAIAPNVSSEASSAPVDAAADESDVTPLAALAPVKAPATSSAPTPGPDTTAPVVRSPEERASRASTVAAVPALDDWDDEERFYSSSEFLTVSGLDAHVMNHLVASGLLSPTTVANQATYNELDLRVARAIKVLLARNIDIRLLGSLRRNVEREIGLLNDVTQPVRPPKKTVSAREARDSAKSVALEIAALRAELFARALHQYLGH